MKYIKKNIYYFISLLFIISIYSFKIDLIPIGGSAVRIDDIIIFFFIFIIILNLNKNSVPKNNKPVLISLIYVIFSIFSVYINNGLYNLPILTGIMYSIRTLEYVIFFYAGYLLANSKFNLKIFVKFYILYAFSLIILQAMNIIPVISKFGGSRVIANTGGPWELAVVISFMLFYSYQYISNKIYLYISFLILILTQSRITSLVVIIIILIDQMKKLTFKKIFIFSFLLIIFIIISIFSELEILSRFANLLNDSSFISLKHLLTSMDYTIDREYYFDTTYGSGLSNVLSLDGDGSAIIRFYRWIILIGMTISTKLTFFIGLGPSFASSAVDGNYVRLFIETGLIGTIIFMYMIVTIYKQTKHNFTMQAYIITIIITAIFIDIYTTYKAMVLLWFYYGYQLRRNKK